MDEWLQLLSQAVGCVGDTHPPASPELVFEPVFELPRHAHDVDLDVVEVVALRVAIAADGFARDDASQAGFFLGFTDRRLTRPFALVHPPFRENPTLPGGGRD